MNKAELYEAISAQKNYLEELLTDAECFSVCEKIDEALCNDEEYNAFVEQADKEMENEKENN